jgi:outer membrane biosynthesis protein TonB
MRGRPARQEKTKTKVKQTTKREQNPVSRAPRKAEAKGSPAVVAKATPSEESQEETVQATATTPSPLVPSGFFTSRYHSSRRYSPAWLGDVDRRPLLWPR